MCRMLCVLGSSGRSLGHFAHFKGSGHAAHSHPERSLILLKAFLEGKQAPTLTYIFFFPQKKNKINIHKNNPTSSNFYDESDFSPPLEL